MGRVAALGERPRVAGLALAGAVVLAAEDPGAVRRAWRSLPDDVDLVILTPAAAEALAMDQGRSRGRDRGQGRDQHRDRGRDQGRYQDQDRAPAVSAGRRRLTTVMPP
ncbi:hypothetical protein ACF09K_20155 [Streptomyces sp. NPDC014882]|uniref:hypothetical protein n=1 Tax=Streptomyces sp. NPDC014882 TaxID=3364927 RepID=UPI003701E4B2